MAIVIDCPHCGKNYKLQDALAGKRVTCANAACRKVFPVQAPEKVATTVAPPLPTEATLDADALALAALADEPPKVEIQTAPIKITCTGCDHQWEVPRNMEGKNTPCPECRKINKVPIQKVVKPVDWRDTNQGRPSLAKTEVEKPTGAWDTDVTKVGGKTLLATGVVKIQYEQLPLWYRIRIPAAILTVILVIGIGIFSLTRNVKNQREERSFDEAQETVEKHSILKDRPEFQAIIREAHAKALLLKVQDRKQLDQVIKLFAEARTNLNSGRSTTLSERQPLLMELALAQVDLGGTKEQVDLETRLSWDKVQTEIRRTLESCYEPEIKLIAIRAVARKLAQHHEATRAFDIARQLFTTPAEVAEAFGAVGLEIARTEGVDTAKAYCAANESAVTQATAMTNAFLIALGSMEKPYATANLKANIPTADFPMTPEVRLGYCEGAAFHNNWDKAKAAADVAGPAELRLRAWIAIGMQALLKAEKQRTDQAVQSITALLSAEGRTINNSWLLVQASRFIAQGGKLKEADLTVNLIGDEGTKSWGKLEVLRGRLNFEPEALMETTWLEPFGDGKNPRVAYAIARMEIGQQQAKAGQRSAFRDYIKNLPAFDPGYAFAEAGLILGRNDAPSSS